MNTKNQQFCLLVLLGTVLNKGNEHFLVDYLQVLKCDKMDG